MDVKVTVIETKQIERTYLVRGVSNFDKAVKCVNRCIGHEFQPNTHLYREVPKRPEFKVDKYEIVNPD